MKRSPAWRFSWFFLAFTIASCGSPNTENPVIPLSGEKAITSFSFAEPAADGAIDESSRTIAVTVPFGTDVTGLIATFAITGAGATVDGAAQTSGTTANDYSGPVVFVVTAADGTTAAYTVTVTVAPGSAKALILFLITDPVAAGTIDDAAGTVSLAVPFDTDLSGLVAAFRTTGVNVTVDGDDQISGTTANDFTVPRVYVVTAADGSAAAYTVTVTKNAPPAQDVCLGGTIEAGQQDVRMPVTSSVYPGLTFFLGTKKAAYGTDSGCIPVYLEVANRSTDPVTLSASQVATLSSLSNALYGPAAFISESLPPSSGAPIIEGTAINPGEHIMLLSLFERDRLTLYSDPPLGGGVITRTLDVQGPMGAAPGTFGISRLDFTFDVDFGTLPLSRVFDPGAGTDFAEGELIVAFNAGTTRAEAEAVVAQQGCHIRGVHWSITAMTVTIPFDKTTGEMISLFTALPQVKYAERNWIVHVF